MTENRYFLKFPRPEASWYDRGSALPLANPRVSGRFSHNDPTAQLIKKKASAAHSRLFQ
jgi:hypothetical protein